MQAPTPIHRSPILALLLLAALLLPAAACEPSPEEVAAERQAVEETLREYADLLSRAYSFSDASVLEPVATQREIASVENNIARMAAEGRRFAVDLRSLAIEEIDLFQANNAYVRTFEVWDIRVMATGSDREISRQDGQRSRVRYHVKRDDVDEPWRVVYRQRLDESSPDG